MHTLFLWLLFVHSLLRWPLLLSLCYVLLRAGAGLAGKRVFTAEDDAQLRLLYSLYWLELLLGMTTGVLSPIVHHGLKNATAGLEQWETAVIIWLHPLAAVASFICVAIAIRRVKKAGTTQHKNRIVLRWLLAALLLLLVSIPWQRPLICGL